MQLKNSYYQVEKATKEELLLSGMARNQVYFQGGDILSPTLHLYTTSMGASLTKCG